MTHTMTRRSLLTGSRLLLGGAVLGLLGRKSVAQVPRRSARPVVRLIANENPYGPSETARVALVGAIDDSWKYAFRQEGRLKELIAEREGVTPKHVMIAAGSGEVLRIAALTYGLRGGEVLAARPTFSMLTDYAREVGCAVINVDLDAKMRHDLAAMADQITTKTRLIYVCNPNNPTGTLVNGTQVREFLNGVPDEIPVLVDEAYLDLWDDMLDHTAVSEVIADRNVIVTRTFSKLHGMAGLRIGYAIARPEIIRQFERNRMSILNLPGLHAATASYQDLEFQQFSRKKIAECLAITTEALDELKLAYAPPRGNFVFFDTGGSVRDFNAAMRSKGILTGRSFAPYRSWCRVSMGTVEDMQIFAAATREYFAT